MAGVTTYHELDVMLTKMSNKSNTAELWIDCFCDSLGKLMIDSGLAEIPKHVFGGMEKNYLVKNTRKKPEYLGFLLRSY